MPTQLDPNAIILIAYDHNIRSGHGMRNYFGVRFSKNAAVAAISELAPLYVRVSVVWRGDVYRLDLNEDGTYTRHLIGHSQPWQQKMIAEATERAMRAIESV